jgi:hypothetical protein
MQIEILILAVIILVVMNSTGQININQMISDNEVLFRKLKEDDWDFLVRAKYGDDVNPNVLFNKRIKHWLITTLVVFVLLINNMSGVVALGSFLLGYGVFKLEYNNLKNYYKAHMLEIDSMLPHYLKNIEILIQHYTVPVAIGKSMADAPDIFKPGLQKLINEINAGNDTINPYMNFAKEYPVRDSMRMMRLLYRLSLGRQERKQEQILAFSRTISALQQKARETKYKNRLEKMENKTMSMLIATGLGVMVLLILSVIQMMNV